MINFNSALNAVQNLKQNNMNNDDIHNEIIEQAGVVFSEAFELMNRDPTEDANKDALLYILINDIIQFDKVKMGMLFDATNILDSVCSIIDESIDDFENKISNKNNSHMVEIKKIFLKKKTDISKKIRDCNESLKKLKKIYLNRNIENYIGNTNVDTLNLKSINTLHSNNKTHNYKLGEFFGRFIFNKIKYLADPTLIPQIEPYSQRTFYDNAFIESFYNNGPPPEFQRDFDQIDNNFKYWLILFFLIVQMFSQNPDYNKLFKQTALKKFIEELVSYKKKKMNDKKKNKKKKGGAKKQKQKQKQFAALIKSVDKKATGKKSDSLKTHNEKEQVNPRDIFKDILSLKVNGNETINSIYVDKFQTKLAEYLLYFIEYNTDIYIDPNTRVFDPSIQKSYSEILCKKLFENGVVSLEQITTRNKSDNFNKRKLNFHELRSEFKEHITLSIYTILILLLINFDKTNEFIKHVKSNLILILFYLFNIKKSIYKYYIEKLDSLFNLNTAISSSNGNLNGQYNRSNNINIVYNNENSVKNKKSKKKSSETKNTGVNNIDRKLEIIKKKIDIIKSKRADINNDEKILILEAKMKELIIKKLSEQ